MATVIKCIAPPTFNNIMYNITDSLLVPSQIKYSRAAPSYIFLFTGTSTKSEMLYIIHSTRVQGYKGTSVQRYNGTRVQGYKNTRVQVYKDANIKK